MFFYIFKHINNSTSSIKMNTEVIEMDLKTNLGDLKSLVEAFEKERIAEGSEIKIREVRGGFIIVLTKIYRT
jgi:hypothetical protein